MSIKSYRELLLTAPAHTKPPRLASNGKMNKLHPQDRPAHDWYRFVLSFPPHLVRDYLRRFEIGPDHNVLDPFCGTGTTPVECKKHGVPSVGIEAVPMAFFASTVKVDWTPEPHGLAEHASAIASSALRELESQGIYENRPLCLEERSRYLALRSLPPEKTGLLLTNSISPLPLHKTLVLLDHIRRDGDMRYQKHELLALAKVLVYSISNLNFGPEVGVGAIKEDADVVTCWLTAVHTMADDLGSLHSMSSVPTTVRFADSRNVGRVVEPESIDAVITSPPYPNEKDYTRTTRLESVLLGFIQSKADLRTLKHSLVRSNTRGVYKDDADDEWVEDNSVVQEIAEAIEERRKELGKTSGFERLYARVTKLYFGGMARHLADLRGVLRPGARLAYVVGDQASYLRVMIRTGTLLAEIAESLGYERLGIDLFRTRLATATRQLLREEVVLLRWPGAAHSCSPSPVKE